MVWRVEVVAATIERSVLGGVVAGGLIMVLKTCRRFKNGIAWVRAHRLAVGKGIMGTVYYFMMVAALSCMYLGEFTKTSVDVLVMWPGDYMLMWTYWKVLVR